MCYRRNGHNEQDNPFFTQPKMYQAIAKQETVLNLYVKKLIDEGVITQQQFEVCHMLSLSPHYNFMMGTCVYDI